MPGLLGKKIGMTSVFSAEGKNLPCTVIEVGPCVVTQIKTMEKDGYEAIQLGFQEKKEKHTTKPEAGHFKKAGVAPQRHLAEFKNFEIFESKVLDDNIGYLKINRFWGDRFKSEFDSLYHEIRKTSKLIIDISENEGGNSGYSNYVISHLIEKPVLSSRWKTLMYMPAYASWGWNTQW